MKDRIEIYSNKKKAFLLLIGSLVFVIGGIYMFINADSDTGFRARSPLFTKIIGVVSILFFGIGIFGSIKQLIRNRLMLIINGRGLNLNPKKNDLLEWKNIEGFREINISGTRIIIIHVDNGKEIIEKEKSKLIKKLMEFNLNSYGSPYNISASTMNIKPNQLLDLLNQKLSETKYSV